MPLLSSALNLGSKLISALRQPKVSSLAGTPTASKPVDLNKSLTSGGLSYNAGPAIPISKPAPQVKAPAVKAAPQPVVKPAPAPIQNPVQEPIKETPVPITQAVYQPPLEKPVVQQDGVLDALRQKVIASYQPSEEEKRLSEELAQFRGSANEGIAALEGQGRGIPLQILRGQEEKLGKQAAIKERTLMERLAAASALRQQALQSAQSELGFKEADIKARQQEEAARTASEQAASKPIEVGGALVRLNPATGKYESVFNAPAKAVEPIKLGEGEALIDPTTGKVITQRAKTYAPSSEIAGTEGLTSSQLAEAVSRGYTSKADLALYKNLIAGGQQAPYIKAPTAEQSKAAGFAERTSDANKTISALESQFTGVSSYLGQNLPNYLKTSDRQVLEQAERNFVNAVLRRESGAAISPIEFESASKQYFPQPGDSAQTLAQKKANRESIIRNLQSEGRIENAGTNVSGSDIESTKAKYNVDY